MPRWIVACACAVALSGMACDAPVNDPSPVPPGKISSGLAVSEPTNAVVEPANALNNLVAQPVNDLVVQPVNLGIANTLVATLISNTSTPPQCTTDADCVGMTATPPACQRAACVSSACAIIDDNTLSCDDGNACTFNDACNNGTCAGTAITCADSAADPCHHSACNGTSACAVTPLTGGACDDHDPCSKNDMCANGTCAGTAYTCAGDSCSASTCDGMGGCVAAPVDAAICRDGASDGPPGDGPTDGRPISPSDGPAAHDGPVAPLDGGHGDAKSPWTIDDISGCACATGARAPAGRAGGWLLIAAIAIAIRRRGRR